MDARFGYPTYVIRRKVFKVFGGAFHIFDPDGGLAFYSEQKAFRLREDIRLFSSEDMTQELLTIQARQIVEWSAAYDVVDATTGQRVGALRRKGWSSLIADQWRLLDANDQEVGVLREDSVALALVRRLLVNLIPQEFHVDVNGVPAARFKQHFNPFVFRMTLDFTPDAHGLLDRRIGLAAAVLLAAVERRQN